MEVMCPVCTLYLRPGISLKKHLGTHPKQKVIEALVKLQGNDETLQQVAINGPSSPSKRSPKPKPVPLEPCVIGTSSMFPVPTFPLSQPGFQQQAVFFQMTQNMNPMLQIQPFNNIPQGMPPPGYMYTQQQTFVTSGNLQIGTMPPIGGNQQYVGPHIVEVNANEPQDNPDLVMIAGDGRKSGNNAFYQYQSKGTLEEKKNIDVQEKSQLVSSNEEGSKCNEPFQPIYNSSNQSPFTQVFDEGEEEIQTEKNMGLSPQFRTTNSNAEMLKHIQEAEDYDYIPQAVNLVLKEVGEECEEGISIDSAHIRADENMPQESNSNASWTRAQYREGESHLSTYDLLARETWAGSDFSEVDTNDPPPYQSHYQHYKGPEQDGEVIISGTSRQGIDYKCSSCSATFVCPKERRVHQAEVHNTPEIKPPATTKPSTVTSGIIGGALYTKKPVKKLVIKPKASKAKVEDDKVEPSFDQLFNNIMKVDDAQTMGEEPSNEEAINDPQYLTIAEPIETPIPPPQICILCCSLVPESTTLRKHHEDVHCFSQSTKYKCLICSETFSNEAPFVEHLVIHPLECLFCGKTFGRVPGFQMHLKRHLGIRPYSCKICSKAFITRQKLLEHQYIHTGEAPIKCSQCDLTFRRHSNLIEHRNRIHLNIKRPQKDYFCTDCGDLFHTKKKLAWHKEIHAKVPKACMYCSAKFVHQTSLTRHIRHSHNERFVPCEKRVGENMVCPVCNGTFLKASFDSHLKSHSKRVTFSCNVCDKECSTKWNLKLHKWTHVGRQQKPFKCELCKSAFIRETDYTSHMNSHRGAKPYTCNVCGAQFIRKYNCLRHVREHDVKKNFNCTVCGKKFHRSYYLQDHMRIHSGARPFSCHICGKCSTTKSNHNKHMRIHHAREPVSTEN